MSQSKAICFGQSNYLLFTTADAEGRVRYETGGGSARKFRVGTHLARHRLAVIDSFRGAWLMDEYARRLLALTLHYLDEPTTVLFGADWGEWLDIAGARHRTPPPQRLLAQAESSLMYDSAAGVLAGEFIVEPQFRECFSEDTKIGFPSGSTRIEHGIELEFAVPAGDFIRARTHLLDRKGTGQAKSFGIRGFPFIFPGRRDPTAVAPVTRPPRPSMTENYSLSGFTAAKEVAEEPDAGTGAGGDSSANAGAPADSGRARLRRRTAPPPAPPATGNSRESSLSHAEDPNPQPARAKLKLRRSTETAAAESPSADSASPPPRSIPIPQASPDRTDAADPPKAKLRLRKK